MGLYEIIVYSAAFVAIVLAVFAFIQTPDEQKFELPKRIKKVAAEYAPQYSPKEKRRQMFWALLWVVPFFAVANYVWLPWFDEYAKRAHCDNIGSFTGFHIVIYILFVASPILIALMLFVFLGRDAVKIWQVGQFPLPGKKVLKPTKYVYGWRARIKTVLLFALVLSLVGTSIWGFFEANELITLLEPKRLACPGS